MARTGAGPLRGIGHRRGDGWRALPLSGEPPLTRLALWLSSQVCTIEIGQARRELGYAPIRSRADGLAELRAP